MEDALVAVMDVTPDAMTQPSPHHVLLVGMDVAQHVIVMQLLPVAHHALVIVQIHARVIVMGNVITLVNQDVAEVAKMLAINAQPRAAMELVVVVMVVDNNVKIIVPHNVLMVVIGK